MFDGFERKITIAHENSLNIRNIENYQAVHTYFILTHMADRIWMQDCYTRDVFIIQLQRLTIAFSLPICVLYLNTMSMIQDSNDQEIREIYERYASLVYQRCRYILRSDDEAWDATQEVFIKLMAFLPKIENRSAIYSWLLATSTNLCISMLRRKKGEQFDECIHGSENNRLSDEKRLFLREIITKLFLPWEKKIRQVVMYSYIDEYSQKEIAQLTGLGESTIRKYLTRFKREARLEIGDVKEVFNA